MYRSLRLFGNRKGDERQRENKQKQLKMLESFITFRPPVVASTGATAAATATAALTAWPERAPTIKGPRASAPEVALSPAIPHSLGQVTNGVKLSPGRPATYQAASGALAKPSASFRRPASLVQAGQPVNKSYPFIGLRVLDMQQQRPPPRGHPQSESDDGEEFIQ